MVRPDLHLRRHPLPHPGLGRKRAREDCYRHDRAAHLLYRTVRGAAGAPAGEAARYRFERIIEVWRMAHSFQQDQASGDELLYFWAFGDLHYNTPQQWRARHAQRLAPMFRDLRALWSQEGAPAFCVSP